MATSEACNTIPAVVVEGYKEKGTWVELGGLKVCMCDILVQFHPTLHADQ